MVNENNFSIQYHTMVQPPDSRAVVPSQGLSRDCIIYTAETHTRGERYSSGHTMRTHPAAYSAVQRLCNDRANASYIVAVHSLRACDMPSRRTATVCIDYV